MIDGLDWWRKALAGEKPPITTTPEAGYFVHRASRSEPFVPCRIYWQGEHDENGDLVGDETLHAEIGGVECDAEEMWLWWSKRPVTKEEYDSLVIEFITGDKRPLPF